MISFGLVNQEAQANATVMGNNFAYYSKQTGLFGQRKEDTVYATLEHDFTKVDGSMYFLPRENTSGNYYPFAAERTGVGRARHQAGNCAPFHWDGTH